MNELFRAQVLQSDINVAKLLLSKIEHLSDCFITTKNQIKLYRQPLCLFLVSLLHTDAQTESPTAQAD